MTPALMWVFFGLLVLAVQVAHAMLGGVAAALWLPVFVIGTLRFGVATPTEVSVMAVA